MMDYFSSVKDIELNTTCLCSTSLSKSCPSNDTGAQSNEKRFINSAKESTGEPELELNNCPIITLTEYLLLTNVSKSLVLSEVIALLLQSEVICTVIPAIWMRVFWKAQSPEE